MPHAMPGVLPNKPMVPTAPTPSNNYTPDALPRQTAQPRGTPCARHSQD